MLSFYLLVVVFAMVCKDAIATCGPGAKRACDVVINKRPRIGKPFPILRLWTFLLLPLGSVQWASYIMAHARKQGLERLHT
ncbi:hypothetical protein KEM48_006053 [Puccinia striiformis f. sp. tritici PST-130]|nr:hypothetical protein KEM48_006053 [Puccinia striiformis f. sp. tritici PST-130]